MRIKSIKFGLMLCMAVSLLICFVSYAAEANMLCFTNEGDGLVYDTSKYSAKRFINFVDIVPGDTYHDELYIRNDSNALCYLFLKVIPPATMTKESEELLESISMNLEYNGKECYSGKANGTQYFLEDSTELNDVMYLGSFNKDSEALISVDLKLTEEYRPLEQGVTSKINWVFVAVTYNSTGMSDVTIIVPPTKTGDNVRMTQTALLLIFISAAFLAVIFFERRERKCEKSKQ